MMPRKSKYRKLGSDPVYASPLVSLLVARVLKSGKKSTALTLVYTAFRIIEETTGESPIVTLERAVKNITPRFALKVRKKGARAKQVPVELRAYRGVSVGLKWILEAASKRSGRSMSSNLAQEIILAAKCRGASFQEKVKAHKKLCSLGYRRFTHLRKVRGKKSPYKGPERKMEKGKSLQRT